METRLGNGHVIIMIYAWISGISGNMASYWTSVWGIAWAEPKVQAGVILAHECKYWPINPVICCLLSSLSLNLVLKLRHFIVHSLLTIRGHAMRSEIQLVKIDWAIWENIAHAEYMAWRRRDMLKCLLYNIATTCVERCRRDVAASSERRSCDTTATSSRHVRNAPLGHHNFYYAHA